MDAHADIVKVDGNGLILKFELNPIRSGTLRILTLHVRFFFICTSMYGEGTHQSIV